METTRPRLVGFPLFCQARFKEHAAAPLAMSGRPDTHHASESGSYKIRATVTARKFPSSPSKMCRKGLILDPIAMQVRYVGPSSRLKAKAKFS